MKKDLYLYLVNPFIRNLEDRSIWDLVGYVYIALFGKYYLIKFVWAPGRILSIHYLFWNKLFSIVNDVLVT